VTVDETSPIAMTAEHQITIETRLDLTEAEISTEIYMPNAPRAEEGAPWAEDWDMLLPWTDKSGTAAVMIEYEM
jgi:hypothetical protein